MGQAPLDPRGKDSTLDQYGKTITCATPGPQDAIDSRRVGQRTCVLAVNDEPASSRTRLDISMDRLPESC